jgi:hypothetical protein
MFGQLWELPGLAAPGCPGPGGAFVEPAPVVVVVVLGLAVVVLVVVPVAALAIAAPPPTSPPVTARVASSGLSRYMGVHLLRGWSGPHRRSPPAL